MNQRQRDHEFRRYFWRAFIGCYLLVLFAYLSMPIAYVAVGCYTVPALFGMARYWR